MEPYGQEKLKHTLVSAVHTAWVGNYPLVRADSRRDLDCHSARAPNWPGVACTTSDLVCTSCTRGVQENGAIGLGQV